MPQGLGVMVTCPECGQAAPDDAKFCDRCGQGLTKSAAPKVEYTIGALQPGAVVRGEFRIVEVLGRSALENRYRAERRARRRLQRVQLRERLGPTAAERAHREEPASAADNAAPTTEDPAGPHAKTAELKPPVPPSPPADVSARPRRLRRPRPRRHRRRHSGASVDAQAPRPGDRAASGAQESVASVNEGANNEVAQAPAAARPSGATEPLSLDDAMAQSEAAPGAEPPGRPEAAQRAWRTRAAKSPEDLEDLGDLFGRVLALSLTINHPAFQRATDGFAEGGRVYLVYPDEQFVARCRSAAAGSR